MNLNTLTTFLSIVRTGSLVGAANELNLTQSAVTSRLQSLEQEMGQPLIHRAKSGATVTAAGQRLIRHAETILGLWTQARQETALPGAFQAVCNLACHPDLWPHLGANLFEDLRQSQPEIAFSIWQGGHADMTGWMDAGLADVCLTFWPSTHPNQTTQALGQDHLVLVSTDSGAPTHFDPNYVFVEHGESFGRDHAAAYSNAATARLSFGTASLGLNHILSHGGSAYLPKRMVASQISQGKLHHITAPEFSRPYYLVANRRTNWPWFDQSLRKTLRPSSG